MPMMKCGCSSNGAERVATGEPVCITHLGLHPGATEVADETPDLTGRQARCADCGGLTDSKPTLPFFVSRPDSEFDSWYSGCRGWD
jgi:hypothetical protein